MAGGKDERHNPNRKVSRQVKLTEVDENWEKIGLFKKMKEKNDIRVTKKTIRKAQSEVASEKEPINFSVAMGKKPDAGGY